MSNPYVAPASPVDYAPPAPAALPVESMIEALRGPGPWVRFLSVLGFVGCAFMVLGGLGMAVLGAIAPAAAGSPGAPQAMMPALGGVYVLFAALYVYPSLVLWRYASSIARAVGGGGTEAIVEALRHQRSFWKFVGISMIAIIGLYFLAIAGFMVFAIGKQL
jgi:hypothetical protein